MEVVAERHGDATDDEAGVVKEEAVHPLVNTDHIWYYSTCKYDNDDNHENCLIVNECEYGVQMSVKSCNRKCDWSSGFKQGSQWWQLEIKDNQ